MRFALHALRYQFNDAGALCNFESRDIEQVEVLYRFKKVYQEIMFVNNSEIRLRVEISRLWGFEGENSVEVNGQIIF